MNEQRGSWRRHTVLIGLALVTVLALILVSVKILWPGEDRQAGRSATSEVGPDGVDVTLGKVRVTAGPDVAPLGTTISLRLTQTGLPEPYAGFASNRGPGIEIELGDGLQPQTPIAISFRNAARPPDQQHVDAVVASSGNEAKLVQADRSGDIITVVTDHLSWFQPVWVGLNDFVDAIGEQMLIAMELRTPQPECVNTEVVDGWKIDEVDHQLFWPCLTVSDDELTVDLINNSPEVWAVTSQTGTAPEIPSTNSIVGTVVAAVALQTVDREVTAPVVPGGQARFVVPNAKSPLTLTSKLAPWLSGLLAVFNGVSTFIPITKLKALAKAECMISIVQTAFASHGTPDGQFVGTVLECLGSVIEGLAGTLIGLVASVPGAATALLDTFLRSLSGRDSFAITLRADGRDGTHGSSAVPVLAPVFRSLELVVDDGYTYSLDGSVTIGSATVNPIDEPPGQTKLEIPVQADFTITNTTPGRNAPIPDVPNYLAHFPSSSPLCRPTSFRGLEEWSAGDPFRVAPFDAPSESVETKPDGCTLWLTLAGLGPSRGSLDGLEGFTWDIERREMSVGESYSDTIDAVWRITVPEAKAKGFMAAVDSGPDGWLITTGDSMGTDCVELWDGNWILHTVGVPARC